MSAACRFSRSTGALRSAITAGSPKTSPPSSRDSARSASTSSTKANIPRAATGCATCTSASADYRDRRAGGKPLVEQGKDREEFADFYRYANERGTLFYHAGRADRQEAPGPGLYRAGQLVGQAELEKEIDVTVAAAGTGRCVPHLDRAREPRSLSPQSLLQERRGLRLRPRRGDARRIRGDRRRRPDSAGRRRLAAGAVGSHRHRDGARRPSAARSRCASRR